MKYIPDFDVLSAHINFDEPLQCPDRKVAVSQRLLVFLLSQVLMRSPFDPKFYRQSNPDVDRSFGTSDDLELLMHYCHTGYFENRRCVPDSFDPKYYYEANDDIRREFSASDTTAMTSHYTKNGRFEMRAPHPDVREDVSMWAQALLNSSGKGKIRGQQQ